MSQRLTRLTQLIKAPRSKVDDALIDGKAVAQWMIPDGMSSQVHE